MQTYKIKKGWSVFSRFMAVFLVTISFWAAWDFSHVGAWAKIFTRCVPLSILSVLLWIHALRDAVIIRTDSFERVGVRKRTILYKDITRVDIRDDMAVVEAGRRKVEINREIENWFEAAVEIKRRSQGAKIH